QSPWDQGTINNFISQVVPWFQSQPDIYAYAFVDVNNGWKMNNGDGSLTATGQHYLNTLRQVQGK
ncbi:glycosyl hydrolase, partial [Enterobacter hormaechei]